MYLRPLLICLAPMFAIHVPAQESATAAKGAIHEWTKQRIEKFEIWADAPSELLIELNARLAPHLRFAWYAAPALDREVRNRTPIDLNDVDIETVLNKYCEQIKKDHAIELQWRVQGQALTIWRNLSDAEYLDLDQKLQKGSLQESILAAQSLLNVASPRALAMLLVTAASQPERIDTIYFALALSSGVRPENLSRNMDQVFDLFGHPDSRRLLMAVLGERGSRRPAPWALYAVGLTEAPLRQAIQRLLKLRQDMIAKEPVFLLLGVVAQDELAKVAAELLKQEPAKHFPAYSRVPNWEQGFLRNALQKGIDWCQNDKHSVEAPDYIAQSAKLAQLIESLQPGALEAQREAVVKLENEFQKAKTAGADRETLRKLEGESNAKRREFGELEKRKQDSFNGILRFSGWGEPVIQQLSKLLVDTAQDAILREAAAEKLAGMRALASVESLSEVARKDPDPRVRQVAADALGQLRSQKALALLSEDLQDNSPLTRKNAIRAIIAMRHPHSAAWLFKLGKETEQSDERQFVLQHLGGFHSNDAEEFLAGYLTETEPLAIRCSAAVGLSQLGNRSARAILLQRLRSDPSEVFQKTAMQAFLPQRLGDAEAVYSDLVELLKTRLSESASLLVLENLTRVALLLHPQDERKEKLAELALETIAAKGKSNNIRKNALNLLTHTRYSENQLARLRELHAGETDPVMKGFIDAALKKLSPK